VISESHKKWREQRIDMARLVHVGLLDLSLPAEERNLEQPFEEQDDQLFDEDVKSQQRGELMLLDVE